MRMDVSTGARSPPRPHPRESRGVQCRPWPHVSWRTMPQDFAQLVRMLRDNASDGAARIARQAVSMLRDFVIHAEGDADLSARTRACAAGARRGSPGDGSESATWCVYWAASFSWPEEDFRAHAISPLRSHPRTRGPCARGDGRQRPPAVGRFAGAQHPYPQRLLDGTGGVDRTCRWKCW